MKSLQQWFDEYGESHRNPTNKLVHWICVPLIFFSIIAMLSLISYPIRISETQTFHLTAAHLLIIFGVVFYVRLSFSMALGILIFCRLCLFLSRMIQEATGSLLWIAIGIFAAAWIGQFIGHKVEGKKPSFLKDVQFLLIGPAWLLGFVYKKVGIKY